MLCPNNAILVGWEWVWGLLQLASSREPPPASHEHFNHWVELYLFFNTVWLACTGFCVLAFFFFPQHISSLEVKKHRNGGSTPRWEVGMAAWLPRRNTFLSRFYLIKRGSPIWVKRYEINYGDLKKRNLIPHVPAFKVTQGHCSRTGSVGYLWLTFSDPQQRWAYLVLFQR